MLNLNDLVLFAAAVEHGGFSAAARRLGVPKSTISKRVAELEAQLAARLIQRTSRSFALTDVGRDFYEHARGALIEAEAAEQVVRSRVDEPSGTVRVTASVPVAQRDLAPHLPRLARAHPKLHVQLSVTDRFVDLVQEGFDIAVRSHFDPLPPSALVQRPLVVQPIILVAAPAYLARRGAPASPRELAQHDGLVSWPSAATWVLSRADEPAAASSSGSAAAAALAAVAASPAAPAAEIRVAPQPRFTANESTVLREAALAGLGIACLPAGHCRAELGAGALVRVLPAWAAGQVSTTILVPHRRGQLPGVRATVEFLARCVTEAHAP